MKKFLALFLALALTLGLFSAAAEDDFVPAGQETPTIDVPADPTDAPTDVPTVEPTVEPSPEPSAEPSPEPPDYPETVEPNGYIVRAGLFYGSTALKSANLENEVGEGYLFGWYDSDDVFHTVGKTDEIQITISAGINSTTSYVVTVTPTGEKIFEFDDGGTPFGVLPIGAEKPVTWHKGYKWNGGFEYRRLSNGRVCVINIVEIGDYTKGVIPYEIGTNWGEEGTKVGAICASSFAVFNANRHRRDGFAVCNTIHCQVYQGLNRATDFSNACCDAVAGEAMYYNGKICNTVYHSSNGGWTEDAKNVWGSDVPYLKAVEDTYEDLDRANHGRWSFNFTGEEIAWVLNQKDYPIGTVTKAWVDLTDAGNVYRVNFQDASGKTQSFEQERARTILGSDTLGKYTYSQRYTITPGGAITLSVGEEGGPVAASGASVIGKDGTSTLSNPAEVYVLTATGTDVLHGGGDSSSFLISGTGWGHNVGLSQWGSRGRAEAGWTYREILEYYYTGAKVMKIEEVNGK